MNKTVIDQRRRALLKGASAAAALAAGAPAMSAGLADAGDPWARAGRIVAKFSKPLSFPARDFVITAYGARPCAMADVAPVPCAPCLLYTSPSPRDS